MNHSLTLMTIYIHQALDQKRARIAKSENYMEIMADYFDRAPII